MKKLTLIFIVLSSYMYSQSGVTIPAEFYGQSYHYTSWTNYQSASVVNFPAPSQVFSAGARLIRIGGAQYNVAGNKPTAEVGYVAIIDDIRKNGFEPVLTIPFETNEKSVTSIFNSDLAVAVAKAKNIIRLINLVHKRNVTRIIIGNEPGKDYGIYDYDSSTPLPPADAADALFIAAYVKALSKAVREADPSTNFQIIGPELEFNIQDLTNHFFVAGDPAYLGGSIVGGPADGKPYLDAYSFHTYLGYSPTINSRSDYIERGYEQVLSNPFSVVSPGVLPARMKIIVDEFNVRTNEFGNASPAQTCQALPNQPKCSHYEGDGSGIICFDNSTADPNSYLSGQLMVDMMGGMIKRGVAASNFWSIAEQEAFGFLHKAGGIYYRKPSYWHYWLMGNYFKGNFYDNLNVTAGTYDATLNPYRGLKAYACKSSTYNAVIVMNEAESALNYTINFNNTGSGNGNFKFNMGGPAIVGSYPTSIDPKSTYMLFFDCSGNYMGKYELKKSEMASDNINFDLTVNHFLPPTGPYTSILPSSIAPLNPTANSYTQCLGSNATGVLNLPSTAIIYKMPDELNAVANTTNLSPGEYKAVVTTTGGCASTASTVFSIHEKSPLVDAGPDVAYCDGASHITALGNSALPPNNYSWSTNLTACASPALLSGNTINTNSCNKSAHYVMSFNDGCPISDDCYVYINSTTKPNDLFIRDNVEDVGDEPNLTLGSYWRSPDIWLSRTQGGPPQNPKGGTTNYVYVRVKNKGCNDFTFQSSDLKVYFKEFTTISTIGVEIKPGIVTPYTITIKAGEEQVLEFPWGPGGSAGNLPDGVNATLHECLDAILDITSGLQVDPLKPNSIVGQDANNWSHKNVDIIGSSELGIAPGGGGAGTLPGIISTSIIVGNPLNQSETESFNILQNIKINPAIFAGGGKVQIDLGKTVYDKWVAGGRKGTGISPVTNTHMSATGILHHHSTNQYPNNGIETPYTLEVNSAAASIDNLKFDANEMQPINVGFSFSNKIEKQYFEYDISQLTNGTLTDGVGFDIHVPECPLPNAGPDVTIGRSCTASLAASPIIANAVYNWYNNATGALVGSGPAIQVSPAASTTYELEMKSPQGCIDYDIVTVNVSPAASCQIVSCPVIEFKDRTLARSETISGREAAVSGTLRIPQNVTLTIDNSKLNFLKDAQLEVMQGGRLEIINSELRGCSPMDKWKGIVVRGNNTDQQQLKITGSTLRDAIAPISAISVIGLYVESSTFEYGTTAIDLAGSKDFKIKGNQFYGAATAIRTNGSLAGTSSAIEKNYITGAKTALSFTADNHSRLTIRCNTFDSYTDYAIYSTNTTLASQGTAAEGAGNSFISSSALVNNKLRHSGNTMTYYYDPSVPVALSAASGLTAIASPSQQDAACTPAVLRAGNIEQAGAIAAVKTYKLYPNPNNGFMNFEYTLSEGETGSFTIYDLTGRKIAQYVLDQSKTTLTINENSLQSGLYFYAAAVNGKVVDSNKIVIIK